MTNHLRGNSFAFLLEQGTEGEGGRALDLPAAKALDSDKAKPGVINYVTASGERRSPWFSISKWTNAERTTGTSACIRRSTLCQLPPNSVFPAFPCRCYKSPKVPWKSL